MMTFTGRVGPINDVGSTAFPADQPGDWTAGCPLWVSGTGSADWRRHVAAPDVVVDVFGFSPASDDQVCLIVREFTRSGDLLVLDAVTTGSAVLVVREPQRVTVLTDLAGVWPVFYATGDESVAYSSSASAVARYVGGEVDDRWHAARLLVGGIPGAWSESSPYRRVAAVPAGGALLIARGGRAAVVARELPLGITGFGAGARGLAEALTSAVRRRSMTCHELSTDLSGRLDSSTVAALASAARPDHALPAITLVCADLGSDDPSHARRLAAAVPGITHVELPLPGEVEPYAGLTEMPHTDEPFEDVSIFARLCWWMATVRELGGRAHLTGDGGDAVLTAPPAYLADLAHRRGRRELWSHAAGWARLRHRPVHRLVSAARRLAGTTQASGIEHYARVLERDSTDADGRRRWEDLISWVHVPPSPQWFTPYARELAAATLRNASRGLGASAAPGDSVARGDAASLGMVQAYGRVHRIHLELAAGCGVALHAPYLDDAVVTACLAVPAAQRTSPRQPKPLLRAAMAGRVPDAALVRSTKGDYSMLAYRGLSRHHRTVADLLTNTVISLDIAPDLVVRAERKHAEHGVGNVAVHATDGFGGWDASGAYDRIVGWSAPHVLPRPWIEQAQQQTVIVTPVKVAPIAGANMILRVDVHDGRPIARDVHLGGYIEMHSEIITDFAVPVRYVDGLLRGDGHSVWVSGPELREYRELAVRAGQMIAAGRAMASPVAISSGAVACHGYLLARRPKGLASAGVGGDWGIGLVLGDSAALLRNDDIYVAGTGRAEDQLRGLLGEWEQAGRPDHSWLRAHLAEELDGYSVRVHEVTRRCDAGHG